MPIDEEHTNENKSTFKPLKFDPKDYLHFLDEWDVPEAKKIAYLEATWQVMVAFVDHGFDQTPIQQALKARLNDK